MKTEENEIKKPSEREVFKLMVGSEGFNSRVEYLRKVKKEFTIERSGSVRILRVDRHIITSMDFDSNAGKGFHLGRYVKEDVKAYLEAYEGDFKYYENTYMEQMFDLENIRRKLGKLIVSVDINNCYWKTAYTLGYITKKTYIKGLRKKEWKIGRNASIGSLAKKTYITTYIDGKPDLKNRKVIHPDKDLESVRNHIIGYVYQMFENLRNDLGSSFYMFLTDCVFIDYDRIRYVENYFKELGFSVKFKPVEFTGIDSADRKINWIEYPRFDETADYTKQSGEPKHKYYIFAKHQLVRTESEPVSLIKPDFNRKFQNDDDE